MHATVKKLALEAGGSHYPDVNPTQLEYFYKLVVKECADWVVTNADSLTQLGPEYFCNSNEKTVWC